MPRTPLRCLETVRYTFPRVWKETREEFDEDSATYSRSSGETKPIFPPVFVFPRSRWSSPKKKGKEEDSCKTVRRDLVDLCSSSSLWPVSDTKDDPQDHCLCRKKKPSFDNSSRTSFGLFTTYLESIDRSRYKERASVQAIRVVSFFVLHRFFFSLLFSRIHSHGGEESVVGLHKKGPVIQLEKLIQLYPDKRQEFVCMEVQLFSIAKSVFHFYEQKYVFSQSPTRLPTQRYQFLAVPRRPPAIPRNGHCTMCSRNSITNHPLCFTD